SVVIIVAIISVVLIRVNRTKSTTEKKKKIKAEKIKSEKKQSEPKKVKTEKLTDKDLVVKRLQTMKKIIERYNKIDLGRLMSVLEFTDTKELDLWLLSLPKELEFYVDGNDLVIPQKRFLEDTTYTQSAINKLEESFKQLAYNCYECGYPIEKDTTICPDCSKEIIRCVVCKLPVSFGDILGKCSLCEAQGHITHMQEWVKTQGKCPQCLQNLPVEGIMPVEPETKHKKK
ncbi:MAG: hypothetical protein ACFFDW_05625, partial [Candidatus Thorarchaeota archaeon]